MKKVTAWLGTVSAVVLSTLLPVVAMASPTISDTNQVSTYLDSVQKFFGSTIIPFIVAVGVLIFAYGMFRYFIMGGDDETAREKGKSLMIYSVLGFVAILSILGIVSIISNSTGLSNGSISTPKVNVGQQN